jgi:hypothetical protein
VVIGGSAVPESIVRRFRDDYGVDVRSEEHTSELQHNPASRMPSSA